MEIMAFDGISVSCLYDIHNTPLIGMPPKPHRHSSINQWDDIIIVCLKFQFRLIEHPWNNTSIMSMFDCLPTHTNALDLDQLLFSDILLWPMS